MIALISNEGESHGFGYQVAVLCCQHNGFVQASKT
jgi:hypothetical protein